MLALSPVGSTYPHGPPRTLSVTQETDSESSNHLIVQYNQLYSQRWLMWVELVGPGVLEVAR